MMVNQKLTIKITPPQTNMDSQNDGLENVFIAISLKYGYFVYLC